MPSLCLLFFFIIVASVTMGFLANCITNTTAAAAAAPAFTNPQSSHSLTHRWKHWFQGELRRSSFSTRSLLIISLPNESLYWPVFAIT